MDTILHAITGFVFYAIACCGYLGIFVLMALESANIPIPSEVVLPFAGFLAARGTFSFWTVALAGTAGNLVGSLVSYWIAYRFGVRALDALTKWHLLRREEVALAQTWFNRWGLSTAFFTRLLPVVRTFISFPIGLARVAVVPFALCTVGGSFIWSTLLTYIGFTFGENWNAVEPYFRMGDYAIVGAVAAGIAWWLWRRRKRGIYQNKKNSI